MEESVNLNTEQSTRNENSIHEGKKVSDNNVSSNTTETCSMHITSIHSATETLGDDDTQSQNAKNSVKATQVDINNSVATTTSIENELNNTHDKVLNNVEPVSQNCESNTVKDTISNNNVTSPMKVIECNGTLSSLNTIAVEYGDSDTDAEDLESDKESNNDVQIMEIDHMKSYRSNKETVCSSEEDSEDDSDSSSSDSSVSEVNNSDENSDDKNSDSSISRSKKVIKSRKQRKKKIQSELDDLPPIEELKITVPEVLCDPLGEIVWMVEQLVVVRPIPGKPTLNLDTVLFVEKGQRPLGKIFDVFGQVTDPHYCVRFNSSEHIKQNNIQAGMTVYYCPNTEYTSLVFLHELTKMKGIDAVGDDEPPAFSDDEEERAYYESLKQKQVNSTEEIPHKRKRTMNSTNMWETNHPWNRNSKHAYGNEKNKNRGNKQFVPSQSGYSQNSWSPFPCSNTPYWPSAPRQVHPVWQEQHGYGSYTNEFQPTQYTYHNTNSSDEQFPDPPYDYYNKSNSTLPFNPSPRVPFSSTSRFPFGGLLFHHNRPNVFPPPNLRLPSMDMSWHSRPPMPLRMGTPWTFLPPPPPPPPPPTDNTP